MIKFFFTSDMSCLFILIAIFYCFLNFLFKNKFLISFKIIIRAIYISFVKFVFVVVHLITID